MDETPHILIVDDDEDVRSLLSDFLKANGCRVSTAMNGSSMMQELEIAKIDLVVLDIMMPGENGLILCRKLRAVGSMPIIMLTAVGGETDRVVGLEMGADDYVPKPFSMRELLARIRAVLRRAAIPLAGAAKGNGRVFEFAGWRLDVSRRQLYSPENALVDLRGAEYDLLLALVERPDHVLTRAQLLDLARGRGSDGLKRSVDVHISRLRHRMEPDPKEPQLIKTVGGGGYVFATPVMLNGVAW